MKYQLNFSLLATIWLSSLGSMEASWIDPETPESAHSILKIRVPDKKPHKRTTPNKPPTKNKQNQKTPTKSPTYLPTDHPTSEPTFSPTKADDATVYKLVMSDEFNVPGRTFADGEDPKWTALEKNDYTNDALHYYSNNNAMTDSDGHLVIKTEAKDTDIIGFNDKTATKEVDTKHFKSAMLQTWNKFCFTGGIIETEVQLPGKHNVGGLWPAFWLLGNLARHTYVGSTNHVWPWSSNTCDMKSRHAQRINSCMNAQHYGLHPRMGRGAPEIDIFEVQPGPIKANTGAFLRSPIGQPFLSASYQVAPGRPANRPGGGWWPGPGQWYDGLQSGANTSLNILFYGDYNHFTGDSEEKDYWSDAVSNNHQLAEQHFNSSHKYRLEWQLPKEDNSTDGYLRWFVDDNFIFEINGTGLKNSGLGSEISTEPMYIIINTAISSQWGFPSTCPSNCDCKKFNCRSTKFNENCGFSPGFCDMLKNETAIPSYKVNYVRVYQDPNDPQQKVGCSTPERPTKQYIEAHQKLYMTENDLVPLKPIEKGGGSCRVSVVGVSKESCGGPTRGYCTPDRKCECRSGWIGPHCLSNTGYDPVRWESADGVEDLNFSWPYVNVSILWIGLGFMGLVMFIAPTIKRRMDGWTPIP